MSAEFGKMIRERRKAKGYSLEELAALTGYGMSSISRVETGHAKGSRKMVHALARETASSESDFLALVVEAGFVPEGKKEEVSKALTATA